MQVFRAMKDLDKLVRNYSHNFPKIDRFTFKDQLRITSAKILHQGYVANFTALNMPRQRKNIQTEILADLQMMDYYFTICYEHKLINVKKLQILSEKLQETQRLMMGWINSDQVRLKKANVIIDQKGGEKK